MKNSQITKDLCKAFYLEFTNNYLTLPVFTEHMNYNFNTEKPVAFWESIVNRGRVAFHSANYVYFTGQFTTNRINNSRRIERLLSEHSA